MIRNLIKNKILILDGAMGTMLQKNEISEIPELLSIKNPDLIYNIHKSYLDSGSDIIYSNTFGANRYKLEGHSVKEIVEASVKIAKSAAISESKNKFVALDIGPIGQMLEPNGNLTFEDAIEIFKEIILAGKDADLIVIETMTDLYEVKAAVIAAKENSDKPIMVTMTLEENQRTFLGCSLDEIVNTLDNIGIDAIGLNCSLGPVELRPLVKSLREKSELPIIIKPNAGLPDPLTGEYSITPAKFAEVLNEFYENGVTIFGGCCGTSPEFISVIQNFKNRETKKRDIEKIPAICSSTKTVYLDSVRIIGERINPTGKKLLKEAIKSKNIDYIIKQAVEQIEAGADILDVNIGMPDINEKEFMPLIIKALQKVVDVPLQIDSSDPEVLEAGLRVYNGKAIVNSVNGKKSTLEKILPVVKKYNAAVVGLTLDESGIPSSAQERFEIAERILNSALEFGIKKEDIYIDCLTLTASAQAKDVLETIKALRMVKEKLGLKTVLGVSNVSFGLPNRELINNTFLAMALGAGLDLPIINPNINSVMNTIHAFNVLANKDISAKKYINIFSAETTPVTQKKAELLDLETAVIMGLSEESKKSATELLKTLDEFYIIDKILIKALDIVGQKFEKNELFLPQLLLSAEAAQAAFDVIKEKISLKGDKNISKGKIILATVKGDIHDIGKNIVKVLLQNYGYEVIDLGKDVSTEKILEEATQKDVKFIGLSALMTTTLKNMQSTIENIRKSGHTCKIVVGGAVLTEEYSKKIGADYYAKDAKSAIDIAKIIFSQKESNI